MILDLPALDWIQRSGIQPDSVIPDPIRNPVVSSLFSWIHRSNAWRKRHRAKSLGHRAKNIELMMSRQGRQPFDGTQGHESFDFARDRETFDFAQGLELVERLVEWAGE